MPEGIAVGVEDGVATVEFLDNSLRGTSLTDLFEAVAAAGLAPDVVVKRTRPRISYSAPEAVARAAGLLDETAKPAADEPEPPKGYDDGQPDMDWSRAAIDDFAANLTPPLDTTDEKNKPNAIKAIEDAIKARAKTPEQAE